MCSAKSDKSDKQTTCDRQHGVVKDSRLFEPVAANLATPGGMLTMQFRNAPVVVSCFGRAVMLRFRKIANFGTLSPRCRHVLAMLTPAVKNQSQVMPLYASLY